jgi:serine/threonine-protein kinase
MPRTAAALVAIALALGAGWVFTGQYVPMPDVVGATQDAAMSTLTEAGLTVRVEQEFSEDVPLGTVVRTAPDAGTRARKGLPVTLVVSKGLERYTIPDDLVGKSEADARSALAALTLVVSEVRQEYSDSVKKGLVLSTDPASGVPLRRGTEVSLVISKGPAPVDVPGILGMDIKEATAALAKVGLLLDVTDQINDDTPEGTILVVKPLPGTTVERGTTISVTVSKGPVLVMVPDVVGLGVKAARTKLEAAGFTVRTEDVLPVVNLNKVYSQSIAGGQLAPKGSTIVLKIV